MYGFTQTPRLSLGSHSVPQHGMCIMELVSFINREEFSDTPSCTHHRIAQYMQNVNDTVTDEERVHLLSVLDRMFHTGGMTYGQQVDFSDGVRELWPELESMLIMYWTQERYATWGGPEFIWKFLFDLSLSYEPMETKLAVLNRILDVADEVMGVQETLPQNRGEIEKMLAQLNEPAAEAPC